MPEKNGMPIFPPWLVYGFVIFVAALWGIAVLVDITGGADVPPYLHGIFVAALWTVTGIRIGRFLNGKN